MLEILVRDDQLLAICLCLEQEHYHGAENINQQCHYHLRRLSIEQQLWQHNNALG